jgi:hypothetical protein
MFLLLLVSMPIVPWLIYLAVWRPKLAGRSIWGFDACMLIGVVSILYLVWHFLPHMAVDREDRLEIIDLRLPLSIFWSFAPIVVFLGLATLFRHWLYSGPNQSKDPAA